MAGKHNDPAWEYIFKDGDWIRRLAGADKWHRAPSSDGPGTLYYDNSGHGHASSNGHSSAVPHRHSRHVPVESPSVARPVAASSGSAGSSSSSSGGLNPRAQAYQPAGQQSSGNSYNAQPRAVVGSDRAPPQAQLGSNVPPTAAALLNDPRHGTLAPTRRRDRKRLKRRVEAEAAARAATALDEAGGDGVTASPEREDEEAGASRAATGLNEHVESQGLADDCVIRDDQAAARSKALLDGRSKTGGGSSNKKEVIPECPYGMRRCVQYWTQARLGGQGSRVRCIGGNGQD